jgi:hypothetical protein
MIKEFTIARDRWWRGKGSDGSSLLREDGNRCCVGFYFTAHGVGDAMLGGCHYFPRLAKEVFTGCPIEHTWLRETRDNESGGVYRINDDTEISDAEREAKLTERFAANGYRVTFVDTLEPTP